MAPGQFSLKRRRPGYKLPTATTSRLRVGEEDLPYEAPSTLPSAVSFSGVLRDVEVECTITTTTTATTSSATVSQDESGGGSSTPMDDEEECAICLALLSDEAVAMIQVCKHTFHERCIRDWLIQQQQQTTPRCPSCNSEVGVTPPGTSPSGTMTIQLSPKTICPGFSPTTTCIEIMYNIPSGTQHSFHENPNAPFYGTSRRAFLPNNEEGCRLLTRLKNAFALGLTFNIGTSLTTQARNAVVWTRAFDHKTSLFGGVFGFPDPRYMATCNAQLDSLGIPHSPHGALTDQHVQHNEVVVYTAPQVLEPPRLLPNVLQPVDRAPDPHMVPATFATGVSTTSPPQLQPITPPIRSASNSSNTNQTVPAMDCPICLEPLSLRAATQIKVCNHVFHHDCILKSLELQPRCPICKKCVRDPQGRSPSGTMSIRCLHDTICPGFHHSTTVIQITYTISSGLQKPYHDHPGTPYSGTRRAAYLPNNPQGHRLLTRLKYAWNHGLIFTVGTSLTTGRNNAVTWTSIPHKTRLNGTTSSSSLSSFHDPHGFPDSNYLTNCNNALDALGVPDADACTVQPQPRNRLMV